MNEPIFVSAKKLNTLEQYAAAMLSSIISLKTIEAFHIEAEKKGLLQDDEIECAKTITWELRRCIGLIKTQMEHIMDRAPIDQEAVLDDLRAMVPDIKIPHKRKASPNIHAQFEEHEKDKKLVEEWQKGKK